MPVYRDNRRGSFYYSFSFHGRRVRSKDFPTRKEAEKAMAVALLEAEKMPADSLTFQQVADVFLKEKQSRLKRQSYDRLKTMLGHFLAVLGDVRVDRLTLSQYKESLAYIDSYTFHGKALKNSYKNKVVRTFKQLCQFASKRYDLTTTIPDKFDPYTNEEKTEMAFITLEQFRRLLSVIEDVTDRALFTCLFYLGLRIGEANALTWADVTDTVTVNKTVTTKVKNGEDQFLVTTPKTSSSYRTLPLPRAVREAFTALSDNLSEELKRPSCFIFGGQKPIPESSLQTRKNRYFKEAGLQPIRLHDFRHSCASFLINNGATPLLVSKWLGHANVSMTLNTYSHLWKSELDEIVQTIDAKTYA